MSIDFIQTIITAIITGGLVSGIFSLVSKRARSPESQNELARLGNDFATKLLEDARAERKELRETIRELENSNNTKQEVIDRLNALAMDKDRRINEFEDRQKIIANKIKTGERVTLSDIFGKNAPEITIVIDGTEAVA